MEKRFQLETNDDGPPLLWVVDERGRTALLGVVRMIRPIPGRLRQVAVGAVMATEILRPAAVVFELDCRVTVECPSVVIGDGSDADVPTV